MRILHVYKDYPPVIGGIEGHIRLLAEAQAQRGLEVTVLATSPDRRTSIDQEHGVRVVRAGRLGELASTPISLRLVRQLRRERADVVHVHMPYPLAELAELTMGGGRPCVVTYHSDVVRQRTWAGLLGPLRRRFLRRTRCVLATSAAYVRSSPTLSRMRDKCRVVPLGVDIDRFAEPERTVRSPIDVDGQVVLFVGRFRHYKGLSVLVEAMTRLDANLVLVGDGAERGRLERQIRHSPARSRVSILSDVTDEELPGCYARADVVVLPSTERSEAFGLTLVEAMASGTPVVSTELSTGTSEVNEHGVTGLVVPPDDPAALRDALHTLLADTALRQRMGRAASHRARASYAANQMVDATLDAYEDAL